MRRDLNALLAFINSRQNTPYEWGRSKNDCVAFVLKAVHRQTGHNRATVAKWHDEKSALRTIKRLGGLEKAFDRFFRRISPSMAMRGDIAGVPDEAFGIHPMIVEGETLVGPDTNGNRRLPRGAMIAAWSATEKPKK